MFVLLAIPLVGLAQTGGKTENPDQYADLAIARFDDGDSKGALKLLRKGAKQGSALCCNRLGDYYGRQENYKQAAKWYTQADDPEGWFGVGTLWLQGFIGEQSDADLQRGLALVRRAERADYSSAIYVTARMFDVGLVLEQNCDSAVAMLQRLVAQDEAIALFAMAKHYEQGCGVPTDSLAALDCYRRAGEAGLSDGYTLQGDYYRHGTSTLKPDPQLAFQTYMLAAGITTDNAEALMRVAECYLQGIGTRVDTARAVFFLRDAVAAGSCHAAAELGDMFHYGRGDFEPNADSALAYYQTASECDDTTGDYMMGLYLFKAGAYENALGYILSAVNNGSTRADVLLAQALLYGQGVEPNPELAVQKLRTLLPSDPSGEAHLLLGMATYKGLGTDLDVPLGFRLIDTAAQRGSAPAMMILGQMYNYGILVERDTVQTVALYERAAAAGSVDAMLQLAGSYRTGDVAPLNPQRAAELYQMAADRGSIEGLCRLGICYERGEGVTLNTRRAYNLYLQAAERGSDWGMRLVAYCYAEGIYVGQDMAKAAQWFVKAAEAGDAHSAFVAGQLYASGDGVKKNKKEARRLLRMASEAGMEEATEALKAL